jgi:hypothetical protein
MRGTRYSPQLREGALVLIQQGSQCCISRYILNSSPTFWPDNTASTTTATAYIENRQKTSHHSMSSSDFWPAICRSFPNGCSPAVQWQPTHVLRQARAMQKPTGHWDKASPPSSPICHGPARVSLMPTCVIQSNNEPLMVSKTCHMHSYRLQLQLGSPSKLLTSVHQ